MYCTISYKAHEMQSIEEIIKGKMNEKNRTIWDAFDNILPLTIKLIPCSI